MPVIAGNAFQRRIQQLRHQTKRPMSLGRNNLDVVILEAYDSDKLRQDGIPENLAPLILREPGTLFARVRAVRSKREFYVGFMASEAEILSTHGNGVLLKGLRGTIIYNGLRPEKGRMVLQGESARALRPNADTKVFDVVSFIS
tara:strand:- start:100 stop:531 length:432 start_codon:yes stop_codon:yes gene_type:complete